VRLPPHPEEPKGGPSHVGDFLPRAMEPSHHTPLFTAHPSGLFSPQPRALFRQERSFVARADELSVGRAPANANGRALDQKATVENLWITLEPAPPDPPVRRAYVPDAPQGAIRDEPKLRRRARARGDARARAGNGRDGEKKRPPLGPPRGRRPLAFGEPPPRAPSAPGNRSPPRAPSGRGRHQAGRGASPPAPRIEERTGTGPPLPSRPVFPGRRKKTALPVRYEASVGVGSTFATPESVGRTRVQNGPAGKAGIEILEVDI